MTRPRRLLLAALAAALLCLGVPGPATGGCVGPSLGLPEEGSVAVGAALTVTGERFVDGCDDTGSTSTWGCSAGQGEGRETETPQREVELVLVQGERRWSLGRSDAVSAGEGPPGRVTWQVTVPIEARPGPATLEAGDARLPVVLDPSAG